MTGFVTIIADASLCPKTHAAGWGCWIKSGPGPGIRAGGPLTRDYHSSTEAEIAALGMAIREARRLGILRPGDTVMLQSDSLNALAIIRGLTGAEDRPVKGGLPVTTPRRRSKLRNSPELPAFSAVAAGLIITVRHVRGHRPHDGGRHSVNRLCDRIARKGMEARRDTINRAEKST